MRKALMVEAQRVFAQDTIAYRLRTARRAAGLSQRELAVPGVCYAYISRIEAGARTPSTKALRQLAARFREHGYDVSASWLETGREAVTVEGPLTDRLVRDLLERARMKGVRGRRHVRVSLEVLP